MRATAKSILFACGFALLYVALYFLSQVVSQPRGLEGVASIFFLPAVVRLLGFLLIDYWIIPALFVAGIFLTLTGNYDLGPGVEMELTVTAFTAVGGPLGVFIASRLGKLQADLANLTSLRLLWLSIGCAAGNAVFYRIGLEVVGLGRPGIARELVVFAGDFVGTWAIIYLIKTCLTLYAYTRRG